MHGEEQQLQIQQEPLDPQLLSRVKQIIARKNTEFILDHQNDTGVYPTNSSRNYLKIQKTELCYTPAYKWAEKGLVPSGTKLHEFKYYYISKKAAQYGILRKDAEDTAGAARDQYYTDNERAEIAKRYQKYRDKTDKLYNLGISILGQSKQTVGGYHPQLGMLLGNI